MKKEVKFYELESQYINERNELFTNINKKMTLKELIELGFNLDDMED